MCYTCPCTNGTVMMDLVWGPFTVQNVTGPAYWCIMVLCWHAHQRVRRNMKWVFMTLSWCVVLFARVEWESKANNKAVEKSAFWPKSTIFGKFICIAYEFRVLWHWFWNYCFCKNAMNLRRSYCKRYILLLLISNSENVLFAKLSVFKFETIIL